MPIVEIGVTVTVTRGEVDNRYVLSGFSVIQSDGEVQTYCSYELDVLNKLYC